MTKEQAIKHLKLMQSGARNAIRHTKYDKEISEEERKEDIEIYQDQLEALEIATKILEQPISDDCVSRTQALKELKESAEHHANDSREEVLLRRDRDIIRALPPVTPTQRWIPVSERLPTENERVLVTQMIGNRNTVYCTRFPFEKTKVEYITAWQPLPESYEERGVEK